MFEAGRLAPLIEAVSGTGRMLDWLENDLRKTRQFWRVAFFHAAPYAAGLHENDPMDALVRQRIVPILERYDVQLVLNGHEHSYQQSQPIRSGAPVEAGRGVVYVTTGGGGATLYPVFPRPMLVYAESSHNYIHGAVQGYRMTLRAVRVDGQVIDNTDLAPPPLIFGEAVVNAASFDRSLAPGTLVSIFGLHLASEDSQAFQPPLPTELSGASVRVNERRLPLLYVSPMQVNAQLPFDLQGQATLRATTPNGSAETSVTISDVAPAIFAPPGVVHPDGTPVSDAFPAEGGEVVSVYLTGLGRVNGEIAAGQAAPLSPLLTVRTPIEVLLGGISIAPSFAGLAPGFVGLYQVNLRVPEQLASGTHALQVVARGVRSNAVRVPVRGTVRG